jgi:hypothetical protein
MHRIGGSIAGALAMMVACAGTEDEMAFGPSPATVGNASAAPSDDGGDTEEDEGDSDGDDDGSAPGDTGGADDGVPPPTDDGTPPPTDDGGNPPPPPPGNDDGGLPPAGDTTPNCQAYCDTLDMCGWVTAMGDMIEDCYFGCSEPLDMGPCDAAWDVLAGCFATLDCQTLDEIFNTGMGTACQAEIQAEEMACAGG